MLLKGTCGYKVTREKKNILSHTLFIQAQTKQKTALVKFKRHHSYSSGYNALLNGARYMAQLERKNISSKVISED